MTTRFSQGELVRIGARNAPGHVRTPVYVRGKCGRVERVLPLFLNPEREGYGINFGTETQLYRVRIKQRLLWPDYVGPDTDVLELEVFEHWLEKVNTKEIVEFRS